VCFSYTDLDRSVEILNTSTTYRTSLTIAHTRPTKLHGEYVYSILSYMSDQILIYTYVKLHVLEPTAPCPPIHPYTQNKHTHIHLPRIIRLRLNLHHHLRLRQLLNPQRRPQRPMVRAPLLQVPDHRNQARIIHGHVVAADLVDLGPSLAAGLLEREIDVLEGLVNLLVDAGGDAAVERVPAAC
jgi:hypothetical protein